jgi:protein-tyrosine phosphatase
MIDLHSHILPGVDDGARSLEESLAIARMAVADGIEVMAATPHFMPGMYDNEAEDIRIRVAELNQMLHREGIELAVVLGSDAHMRPDFVQCLRDGTLPTLHGSRYVLFEPPHNVKPPRLDELLFNIQVAGYMPIFTHPERLKWIEHDYDAIKAAAASGVWMQITAGSLTGRFGKRPKYWAERMLGEGLVSILATDAHNTRSRPPLLAEAVEIARREVGMDEATHLVVTRPYCVIEDEDPAAVPQCPAPVSKAGPIKSLWRSIFGGPTT